MLANVKAPANHLPEVDAYIAKAAPFAQPVLMHLRELVHKAAPEVEEAIKWSMPFFVYRGIMLANMAAFKQHCAFGIWGKEIAEQLRADGLHSTEAMGSLGRITSLDDLPKEKDLIAYIGAAAALVADGTRTRNYSRTKQEPKPEAEVPSVLVAALEKNKVAKANFDGFPPGCRREYVDWITEAKREETRDKRVAQAVEWIAEGKRRNWKYEDC